MANKVKGIVKLDSKWSLRYTTNALVEMEDALGLSAPELFYMLEQGRLGFKEIRTIVWAGLIHQFDDGEGNYDLTLYEAGEVIDKFGFDETIEKVTEALAIQFPDDVEGEVPKANREQRRQGIKEKN